MKGRERLCSVRRRLRRQNVCSDRLNSPPLADIQFATKTARSVFSTAGLLIGGLAPAASSDALPSVLGHLATPSTWVSRSTGGCAFPSLDPATSHH